MTVHSDVAVHRGTKQSLTANRMVRLAEWPEAMLWAVHSNTGRFAVGETIRIDWAGAWPEARILDKDGPVLVLEILKGCGARPRRTAVNGTSSGLGDADAERGEPALAAIGETNGLRVRDIAHELDQIGRGQSSKGAERARR